jgi:hypothetical protein
MTLFTLQFLGIDSIRPFSSLLTSEDRCPRLLKSSSIYEMPVQRNRKLRFRFEQRSACRTEKKSKLAFRESAPALSDV